MKLSFKKKKQKPCGKLIVLDGIDGSGKSTQLELLNQELRANGFEPETIHFPRYGQPAAYFVDRYLRGAYKDLNPYAASIFYAVDRFEAAAQIRKWLAESKIVLSDRYITANAAHQGCKIVDAGERAKFFKWLDNLEYNIFGIPKADLNIILDMPYLSAHRLLNTRKKQADHEDNIHEKSLTHLRLSREVFVQIAKMFPNTKMVECVKDRDVLSPQQIHNKVWELVRRIALKDLKM